MSPIVPLSNIGQSTHETITADRLTETQSQTQVYAASQLHARFLSPKKTNFGPILTFSAGGGFKLGVTRMKVCCWREGYVGRRFVSLMES